jgi:hypothetical protein
MTTYALIDPQGAIDRRVSGIDPNTQVEAGWKWLPVTPAAVPIYAPKTEKVLGPTYTVGAEAVTESYSVVALTAQEISDAKDSAVNSLNGGTYATLLEVILSLENDNRIIKAKINQLITDTSASTAKFTAGQAGAITMTQLKAAIKALLQ